MSGSISKKFALLALAVAPACHAQKQLLGDWHGNLNVQGNTVQLVWHVTTAPDGTIVSTFDNQTEGVTGIKVKSLELKGSDLTVTINDSINAGGQDLHVVGVLTGKLSADGNEATGEWEQSSPQEASGQIDLKRAPSAVPAAATQPGPPAAQPKIAGDWQGKLSAGGAELTIILHIEPTPDGKLSATMDSVDQGAMGIPVNTISLDGSHLNFTVDAVQGNYAGVVNADTTAIDGSWTQGAPIPLNFTRAVAKAAPSPAPPTELDGMWMGTLNIGGMNLRAVFKIANTTAGLTAQMQSPDQSPNWLPVTSVTRDADTVTLDMKAVGASFTGKLSADKQSIDGTFTQMDNSIPLVLKRVKDEAAVERIRPQNPVKPYPYREQDHRGNHLPDSASQNRQLDRRTIARATAWENRAVGATVVSPAL